MSETDPISFRARHRGSDPVAAAHPSPSPSSAPPALVRFDRKELDLILRLYGRMVAAGEWRDYGIDMLKERAVFSVFRRSSEFPLYRIVKDPKLARRQGAYSVVTQSGLILRRGHELARVLMVLERKPEAVPL